MKAIKDYGICYTGYPSILKGLLDASWITNKDDHLSTSDWIFMLGGGAVSLDFKKQTCIINSTMTTEFVVLASVCKKIEWLRNLLYGIPLWPRPLSLISIHCDSVVILLKTYSQVYIGWRHSYVKDLISNGIISIDLARSNKNLSDPLTKGLSRDLVLKTSRGMSLKSNLNDH